MNLLCVVRSISQRFSKDSYSTTEVYLENMFRETFPRYCYSSLARRGLQQQFVLLTSIIFDSFDEVHAFVLHVGDELVGDQNVNTLGPQEQHRVKAIMR